MKRLIAFLLALTMLFALAACSAKNENTDADAKSSGTTRLVLGTSTTGSTYYILGTGWADVKQLPAVSPTCSPCVPAIWTWA